MSEQEPTATEDDSEPSGDAEHARDRALSWVAVIALVVFVVGRVAARRLPPDGVLRQVVGHSAAVFVFTLGTIKASVAGWRLWRGPGADPYSHTILPTRLRTQLGAALPALAVACWGALVSGVVAVLFPEDGGPFAETGRFVDSVVTAVGFGAVAVFVTFALFSYTAARWRWPRFVLPAELRQDTDGGSARHD